MMLSRLYLVCFVFVMLSVAMIARLCYLQLVEKDFLQDEGDARTIRMERINAHRGIIQDSYGKALAVSTPALSLFVNPSEILDAGESLEPLTN